MGMFDWQLLTMFIITILFISVPVWLAMYEVMIYQSPTRQVKLCISICINDEYVIHCIMNWLSYNPSKKNVNETICLKIQSHLEPTNQLLFLVTPYLLSPIPTRSYNIVAAYSLTIFGIIDISIYLYVNIHAHIYIYIYITYVNIVGSHLWMGPVSGSQLRSLVYPGGVTT